MNNKQKKYQNSTLFLHGILNQECSFYSVQQIRKQTLPLTYPSGTPAVSPTNLLYSARWLRDSSLPLCPEILKKNPRSQGKTPQYSFLSGHLHTSCIRLLGSPHYVYSFLFHPPKMHVYQTNVFPNIIKGFVPY